MMVVSENGEMVVSKTEEKVEILMMVMVENAKKVEILVMIVYENADMVEYNDEVLVESHIANFQYARDFVMVAYFVVHYIINLEHSNFTRVLV